MKPTATQRMPDKGVKIKTNTSPTSSSSPGYSTTITIVSDRLKSLSVTSSSEFSTASDHSNMQRKSYNLETGVSLMSSSNAVSSYSSGQDVAADLNGHGKIDIKGSSLEEFVASLPPLPPEDYSGSNRSVPLPRSSISFLDSHDAEPYPILCDSLVRYNSSPSAQTTPDRVTRPGQGAFCAPSTVSVATEACQGEQTWTQVPRIHSLTAIHDDITDNRPPSCRKTPVAPFPMASISESESPLEMTAPNNIPEMFHIHIKDACNKNVGSGDSTFVGLRDIRDTRSLEEKQIVSAKGTVRGFRNRVRAGITTYVNTGTFKSHHLLEKGCIIVYTTSMTVVRETYDRCRTARNILQTHMVRFEERDLYMSRQHQREVRQRLDTDCVELPQIFVDGFHIGGAQELERLNESEELRKIFHSFPKIQACTNCDSCGGYRFVPCGVCHGSKKSVHRNHFTEEFCALRCMHCNESGLQRCDRCQEQRE